ncbi:cellulose binding domain-containing protein [Microbispora triticiradicis]|uniref:cellulose binding domain-containing protein n=1 Tax=Microbispora triticiradicis TaxID=2200763 RepID=UPI001AD75972|nr:cellulose binding domain-containing protein [Microbispora triticiradicis]MBO4273635.1 alpha-L-arabinofuranosidase [Microbispora triticiradicis]
MHASLTGRRRVGLALLTSAALAAASVTAVTVAPASAATSATVTVNTGTSLGTIPAAGHGVNVAVYDGNMNSAPIAGLLRDAGFTAVRYPGGSYGDIYHWKTNTTDGGYVAPNTDFDTYMGTVRSAGAQPVIIANYGTGTAQEAADWVRYANVTKGYGVKYWEIGNEVYGNGHYGSGWEQDNHSDKSPRAYANNVLQYISAMKAVDSSIKVGVVLTTPGGWPDGIVGSGDSADWNNTVMSIVQDKADFVIVHWYPGATSAADSLGKVSQISTITSTVRSLIAKYAGSRASSIGISVTELNPSYQLTTATAALFATDSYLTWFENGAMNLDWWNLHNGTSQGPATGDDGTPDYHDEGILSSGASGEPAANTPFPPYYGLAMVGRAGSPGDTLVKASSSSSLLSTHAVRTSSGVNVVLINKDLNNSTTVSLSYSGFSPGSAATVVQWRKGATSISTSSASSATSITLPPYSVTVLKASGGGTSSPSPSPSASPSRSPSPSPSASASPSVSPSVSPSASPDPGQGCTATYTVTNSWPGGFQAEVTVKNTRTTPISGWTAGWSYRNGQTVSSSWNATVSQSGAAVTAKNVNYNGSLAAGASTSFGFTGNATGANEVPSPITCSAS